MAGRGMGAATQGGGAVTSGPKNRMENNPAGKSTGIPMMAKGGAVNQHKRMAMGKKAMAEGGDVTGRPRRPLDAVNPEAISTTPPPRTSMAPKRKLTAKEIKEKMRNTGQVDAKKKNMGGMVGKMMRKGGCA